MLSDSSGGVGGLCTSAKVDGKQAHDKSLTFVWALSFCCRDNVEGQKGGEMSRQKMPLFTEVQIKPDFDLCGCTCVLFVFI